MVPSPRRNNEAPEASRARAGRRRLASAAKFSGFGEPPRSRRGPAPFRRRSPWSACCRPTSDRDRRIGC